MEQNTQQQSQKPKPLTPQGRTNKIIAAVFVIIIVAVVGAYIASKNHYRPSQSPNDSTDIINPNKNGDSQKIFSNVVLEDVPIEGKAGDVRLVKINKNGSRKVVIDKLREKLQEDERTLFILHKFDNTTAYIVSSFDVKGLDAEGLNRTIEVDYNFYKIDLNTGVITESDNQDGAFGDYTKSEILQ